MGPTASLTASERPAASTLQLQPPVLSSHQPPWHQLAPMINNQEQTPGLTRGNNTLLHGVESRPQSVDNRYGFNSGCVMS